MEHHLLENQAQYGRVVNLKQEDKLIGVVVEIDGTEKETREHKPIRVGGITMDELTLGDKVEVYARELFNNSERPYDNHVLRIVKKIPSPPVSAPGPPEG